MKLNTVQVEVIEAQTGAIPIPHDNPANEALVNVFGEHTFYADQNGLHVLETVAVEETTDGEHAEVIQIAEWANEDKSELQPIEPRRTGAVFGLDAETAAVVVSAEPIAPNDDV